VLTVLAELPINLDEPTIFILIKTLLPLIFAYFTFHFHGGAYRLIGLWCLYDLLESILITGVSNIVFALKLLILFLVIVLTFFIARKVFPNLKVLGPKQDPNGNYLL
jgi:ABC-type sulfate transport system permease subunit